MTNDPYSSLILLSSQSGT